MRAVSRVEEINALVRKHTGFRGRLSEEVNLFPDLFLLEPDLDELLTDFAERFRVDLAGFRWYVHTDEDGVSVGRFFFRAPQDRVTRIPISLGLLYRAAEIGRWPIDYPEHSLPARRWDRLIDLCMVCGIAAWLLWSLVRMWPGTAG